MKLEEAFQLGNNYMRMISGFVVYENSCVCWNSETISVYKVCKPGEGS